MKLLECAMGKDIKRRTFEFSGELTRIEVENGYVEIEADNLHIIETTGGTRVDFEPKGKTWQGKNIDSEYAMLDVISRYSRNETVGFEMLYLCESLQQFLDHYTKDVSFNFCWQRYSL